MITKFSNTPRLSNKSFQDKLIRLSSEPSAETGSNTCEQKSKQSSNDNKILNLNLCIVISPIQTIYIRLNGIGRELGICIYPLINRNVKSTATISSNNSTSGRRVIRRIIICVNCITHPRRNHITIQPPRSDFFFTKNNIKLWRIIIRIPKIRISDIIRIFGTHRSDKGSYITLLRVRKHNNPPLLTEPIATACGANNKAYNSPRHTKEKPELTGKNNIRNNDIKNSLHF